MKKSIAKPRGRKTAKKTHTLEDHIAATQQMALLFAKIEHAAGLDPGELVKASFAGVRPDWHHQQYPGNSRFARCWADWIVDMYKVNAKGRKLNWDSLFNKLERIFQGQHFAGLLSEIAEIQHLPSDAEQVTPEGISDHEDFHRN